MSTALTPVDRTDVQKDEISFGEYLATLVEARLLIGVVTLVAVFVGAAYAVLARPIFRSDVLLQVEQKSNGLGGLEDLSSMFSGDTPAEAEIEILRSRSVVGAVVDELGLDVRAEPKYFPIVGAGIARLRGAHGLASPVLGMTRFAWGGERIKVGRLQVPEELEGERLTLRVEEEGRYRLTGPDGELLVAGKVGEAAAGRPGAGTPGVEIFVSELVAHPGARFRVTRYERSKVISGLQTTLDMKEKGKKTGIISVSLDGPDVKLISATLDALANAYVRQNVERRSEEAEKTLQFLNTQLPELKAKLDQAEAALNTYRSNTGRVDVTIEVQAFIDRTAEVEKQLTALNMERSELEQRFTDNHPVLESLRQKIRKLEEQKAALNSQIKRLPDAEMQSARLMRDVKVDNELYMLLLNKTQELRVVKSGTIGNVRVLDHALISREPVLPRRAATVGVSALVGLALGIVLAFARRALSHGVEDPELIEKAMGVAVYASVPLSERNEEMVRSGRKRRGGTVPVLALADSTDLAVESLRSLRTSLQFALLESKNNVLSITGPSPAVGKSFVSANLAHVLGDADKRVLLIDADMRRGRLHEYFGGERKGGLSEVIRGEIPLEKALRPTQSPAVTFLSTGSVPPNAAELLMSERFERVLQAASSQFDLVVVDTPPILAVTDAAVIGRLSGVNLVVLRSGLHPMREIQLTIKRLQQNGVRLNGVVFNGVPRRTGAAFGRYAYHYQYEYKNDAA